MSDRSQPLEGEDDDPAQGGGVADLERLDRVTVRAAEVFGTAFSFLSFGTNVGLRLRSCHGLGPEVDLSTDLLVGDSGMAEPCVVEDTEIDARTVGGLLVAGEPRIGFFAGHPLRDADGEVRGLLAVMDPSPRPTGAFDLERLADLARWAEAEVGCVVQVDRQRRAGRASAELAELEADWMAPTTTEGAERGIELSRNPSIAELDATLARLAILDDLGDALNDSSRTLDEILGFIVERASNGLAEACAISLVAEDGLSVSPVAMHHCDPGAAASMEALFPSSPQGLAEGVDGLVVDTGEPLFLAQIDLDALGSVATPGWISHLEALRATGLVVAPLLVEGDAIGTIHLIRTRIDDPFSTDDLRLVEKLARRSAAAIQNMRTQVALAESEARFRRLVDQAPDVVYWIGFEPEFHFEYVSPALSTVVGHEPEAFYADPQLGIRALHPDDVPTFEELLAHPEQADRGPMLLRWMHADGEVRWMQHRLVPVIGPDGKVAALGGIARDITALKQAQDELAHRVLHDGLTGLPNRELFGAVLTQALLRLDRASSSIAVLFVDLDRFKVVNDSLGHAMGDQLLIAVVARLRRLLRPSDTLARLGGDEFLLLLEVGDDVETAGRVAERIQSDLAAPFIVDGHEIFTTVSIGVALTNDPHERPENLLRHADVAMYRAKSSGGGRFEVFDEHLRSALHVRLDTETGLRRALDREELRVLYQPIVDLETGEVTAAEALVRWQRGSELVGAEAFIKVAEETGLIVPIGAWVFDRAADDIAEINCRHRPIGVHVNLSTRQLSRDGLAPILESLARSGLADRPPMCLEITESTLMNQHSVASNQIEVLRQLGVDLAIDDFGTGYSSLAYLKQLTVDILKIDQSFVDGVDRTVANAAIVAAIVSLAHTLELEVVAEGVETHAQLQTLRDLSCDQAQGFLLAPPLTLEGLEAFLDREDPLRILAPV